MRNKVTLVYTIFSLAVIFSVISFPQEIINNENVAIFSLKDTTLAAEYLKKGDKYFKETLYDSSSFYYEKAKYIYKKIYNQNETEDILKKILDCDDKIGWNLITQGKYDSVLELLIPSGDFVAEKITENHSEVAQIFNTIGVAYWYKADLKNAFHYYQKSLDINLRILGEENSKVASGYNNIGIVYNVMGDYEKALEYYQKNLKIKQIINDIDETELAKSFTNIGNLYYNKGDYDKALEYHEKSLSIRLKVLGENNPYTSANYTNLGATFANKKDYRKALDYFNRALLINTQLFGEAHPKVGSSYDNIGSCYYYVEEYDSALINCLKSLEIKIKTLGETHSKLIHNYITLGKIYKEKKDFNHSIEFLEKAIKVAAQSFESKHPDLGLGYLQLAEIYMLKNDFDNSLKFCQKSLISLVSSFNDESFYSNPELSDIISETELLSTLSFKAKLFNNLSEITGQRDLEMSLSTYQLAIDLIDKIRTSYKTEGSKLFLGEKSTEIYEQAIQTSLKLFEITNNEVYKQYAFYFIEKSKAAVLQESLAEVQAKQFSGITRILLEEEKQLKIDLAFYETQLQSELQKKDLRDSIKINDYQNNLFKLRSDYGKLILKFENEYPDYYNLKYQTKTISVNEIQNRMNADAALIEYFVGDSIIYIFIITNNELNIIRSAKPDNFSEQIRTFYTSILKTEKEKYILSANEISSVLILPVLENLRGSDKETLIIIPHDLLYKIPFEALFSSVQESDQNDYSAFKYLILDYNIFYHYSASLYINGLKQVKEEQMNFIGFAPVFSGNDLAGYSLASNNIALLSDDSDDLLRSASLDGAKLNELKYSEFEVRSVMELFLEKNIGKPSISYFYSDATEEKFKANVNKFDIVHIATHSFINEAHPQISGIIFALPGSEEREDDGILYAGEIYNLDLNADLLVLSSCESGLGKLIKGEGMMALTRGFLYAGAANIIFSLWKIPDKPTSELMIEFYKYAFNQGKSYSESLRDAKLNLIKNPATARPRSWASFILIGGD